MKTLFTTLALALLAATASADSVWTYSGNATSGASNVNPLGQPLNPNPCACALDGSVTLDGNSATAWNFAVDGLTLTNLNSTGSINDDLNGANPNQPFYTWRITLNGPNGSFIGSYFDGSTYEATDGAFVPGTGGMYEEGNKGTWTDAVSTAEPGTLALLSFGLAALTLKRRRKPADYPVWEPLA
jgi:hypothetical protein